MNILVTGADGFIGSHLVKSLPEHNVIKWKGDIKKFVLDSSIDFVVHLAALTDLRQSIVHPNLYWKTNVEYSRRIFDSCLRVEINVPVVYASSSCVKEWWRSPYGTTKKVMEELAHTNHVGLRFTTVWGSGARNDMLISKIVNGNLKYKTNHIRDFIHVSDVISAIKLFIDTGTEDKKNIYDVGSGKGVKIDEYVESLGIDVPLKEGSNCESESNIANITEMKKLGWNHEIDLCTDWQEIYRLAR
mgnify:CR=1 FL=1